MFFDRVGRRRKTNSNGASKNIYLKKNKPWECYIGILASHTVKNLFILRNLNLPYLQEQRKLTHSKIVRKFIF
jgi:hypothetical protein